MNYLALTKKLPVAMGMYIHVIVCYIYTPRLVCIIYIYYILSTCMIIQVMYTSYVWQETFNETKNNNI